MTWGVFNPASNRCKKCKGEMKNGQFYMQKSNQSIGLHPGELGDGPYCLRCYDSIRNGPDQDTVARMADMKRRDKETGLDKAVKRSNRPRGKKDITDRTIID